MDACQPNPCTQGGQCQVRYGGSQLNQNNGGHTGAGHYWYPGRTTPDSAEQSCRQSGAQVCCRCPNHAYTRDCSAMRKYILSFVPTVREGACQPTRSLIILVTARSVCILLECFLGTECILSLREGNVFNHGSLFPEWGCNLCSSDFVVFSENRIVKVIAELCHRWRWSLV